MRFVDTIVQDNHQKMTTNNWSSIESALFIWKKKKNDIWNMIRKCSHITNLRPRVGCNQNKGKATSKDDNT